MTENLCPRPMQLGRNVRQDPKFKSARLNFQYYPTSYPANNINEEVCEDVWMFITFFSSKLLNGFI